MQTRKRISDNSIQGLVGIGVLSIFVPPVVILISQDYSLAAILSICLFCWVFGLILILNDLFRDQIDFDGSFFYVSSWQGKHKVTVPIADISSLISSRAGFRFYYNTPEGNKKFFFFNPSREFHYDKMVKNLKQANPYFFTSSFPFLKGLEFLFFKDEEWFK